MTHDAIWFSRPRKYGKGSRQWYAVMKILLCKRLLLNPILAASARTRLVLSASTELTCADSASVKSLLLSVSLRYDCLISSIYTSFLNCAQYFFRTGKAQYIPPLCLCFSTMFEIVQNLSDSREISLSSRRTSVKHTPLSTHKSPTHRLSFLYPSYSPRGCTTLYDCF